MMKKAFALLLIIFAALFGVASFGGCGASERNNSNNNNSNNGIDDPVDYYGCPNSKRIRKLNLKKSKR